MKIAVRNDHDNYPLPGGHCCADAACCNERFIVGVRRNYDDRSKAVRVTALSTSTGQSEKSAAVCQKNGCPTYATKVQHGGGQSCTLVRTSQETAEILAPREVPSTLAVLSSIRSHD